MGTGTDAAIEAGGLTPVRGDLRAAADAVRPARRILGTITIRSNLFWAFAYNVAALPLAASGLPNPVIAGRPWRSPRSSWWATPCGCGRSGRPERGTDGAGGPAAWIMRTVGTWTMSPRERQMSERTRPVPPADGLRRIASEVLSDLRAVDGALYAAVAATPTPTLDRALRRLSHAADHSKISFAIAGALALAGSRPRRAALAGVGAIAVASASANLLGKRLVRRDRPDREAARVTVDRHVPMPMSASFPSGHTASAVAFATAVGTVLPAASVPLGALAGAVGYSRIHTGVHYPGDVAAGAVLGVASAATALAVTSARLPASYSRGPRPK